MNWFPKRSLSLVIALPAAALIVLIGLVIGVAWNLITTGAMWCNLED